MANEVFGLLTYWRGEFDAAKELLEEARRRFDAEDCLGGSWACGFDLGYLALAKGDSRRARVELERALEVSRSSGSEDLPHGPSPAKPPGSSNSSLSGTRSPSPGYDRRRKTLTGDGVRPEWRKLTWQPSLDGRTGPPSSGGHDVRPGRAAGNGGRFG
ncbi:MAG: tetratricopeptide repeat protein [Acidimicrobiia bacterium]